MPGDRPPTPLTPYAGLPESHGGRHVVHSTVDARGRAHWLLTERRPEPHRGDPYDAVVVTVEGGSVHETVLSGVHASYSRLDALPAGGFVLAAPRSRRGDSQVSVLDSRGRRSRTFRVGDGIEDLLVDHAGDVWVGYFDEGVYGDALSAPGLRRWSATGEPLWAYQPLPGFDTISDCYALNVAAGTVWACPYPGFRLLEIREDGAVRARENPVQGAKGVIVEGDRVVFFSPYGDDWNVLVDCRLSADAVRPVGYGRLVRSGGADLGHRRRRVVCRGPRLYVQQKPWTQWAVLDIGVR
ncbi:hypothetical protein [Streptomyces sp. NPDC054842]